VSEQKREEVIYIAGPDGKPMEFASEADLESYRRAQRDAEPPLLQCLRKHHSEVQRLRQLANDATLAPRGRGRGDALNEIARRLAWLNYAMVDDIEAATREIVAKEPKS